MAIYFAMTSRMDIGDDRSAVFVSSDCVDRIVAKWTSLVGGLHHDLLLSRKAIRVMNSFHAIFSTSKRHKDIFSANGHQLYSFVSSG